jgi:hypothetical protein
MLCQVVLLKDSTDGMHIHALQRTWPGLGAGNAVDQIEADLVLLSTEAVHSKAVDANLLAEFVTCPGPSPSSSCMLPFGAMTASKGIAC